MQGVKMIGQILQNLLAQRFGLAVSAVPVCADGGQQQLISLLPGLLLLPGVPKRTRAHPALQLQFPTKTPSSRWVLGFSVIRQQFANAFSVIWQPFRVIPMSAFC